MIDKHKYKRPTVINDDLKSVHKNLRSRILIMVGIILFLIGTSIHAFLWCIS